ACLALGSNVGVLAPHPLAAVRQLAGFVLRVIPWRSRKRQSELRLVRIRRLRSSATVSTKVRSGCWAIRSSICSANSTSGKTLPPRGFGTALLLSCQRFSHFTAELTLTSKRSAVSRRDAPPSTSFDYAFPQITRIGLRHRPPPQQRINARRFVHPYPFGNPADSNRAGTALVVHETAAVAGRAGGFAAASA